MVGSQAGGFVDRARIAALKQHVLFGAHDEEGRAEREDEEALEINVAAVHHIECSGFGKELVEDVHIVHFALCNADKGGDIAVKVEQRVHLDGGLVLAESSPRKQREAEIDRGGVQGVETLLEIDAHRIVSIQRSRNTDQHLGKIGEDAPVAILVGIGQRRARHVTAEAQVVKFPLQGAKARLDIAKAFAVSQLSEGHRQILIPARELPQSAVPAVAGDTTTKLAIGKEADQL